MRRYLTWLKRRILGRRRSRAIPACVRPTARQPVTPSHGLDVAAVREWFAAISVDGSPVGALADYARQDFDRFLRTVELVPGDCKVGLEIGAGPYFTTTLLSWTRPDLHLSLTNFFDGSVGERGFQHVEVEGPAGKQVSRLTFANVNIEADRLPHDDGAFEVVLYCEVLEHLTNDPVASLREISRVLKSDGCLVLTTPNAARLESATRLLAGLNIYDQYSGYGPYGRHNREYTVDEVRSLLKHCGFKEDLLYTADVYDNHAALHVRDPRQLVDLVGHRADLLGQYIFSRWRKDDRAVTHTKPAWLYRSLPAADLSDDVPLTEPKGARH